MLVVMRMVAGMRERRQMRAITAAAGLTHSLVPHSASNAVTRNSRPRRTSTPARPPAGHGATLLGGSNSWPHLRQRARSCTPVITISARAPLPSWSRRFSRADGRWPSTQRPGADVPFILHPVSPCLHENTLHHRAEAVGKTCARAARTSTSLIAAQFALPHGRCGFAPERANAHVEVDLRTIAERLAPEVRDRRLTQLHDGRTQHRASAALPSSTMSSITCPGRPRERGLRIPTPYVSLSTKSED